MSLRILIDMGDISSSKSVLVLSVFSVQNFDLANHLQTAPELVNRVYNRPTLETLERKSVQGDVNPHSIMVCLYMMAFNMKLDMFFC